MTIPNQNPGSPPESAPTRPPSPPLAMRGEGRPGWLASFPMGRRRMNSVGPARQ